MKHRISALTLLLVCGAMLWTTACYYPRYKEQAGNATIAWDGAGYYWYLPSLFIYGDLGRQQWAGPIIHKYQPGAAGIDDLGVRAENGNIVMKYPAGLALMEAPFFAIAHILAAPLGYPADGFSLPYQAAIQYGALLVSFLGLWAMRRLLLHYFSDSAVALSIFLLVVGTNYLNYSSIDGSIAHCWLFTVYALLMCCAQRFYHAPSTAKAAPIGLLCGLAILTRPTEVVALVIPLMWNVVAIPDIKPRLLFLLKNRRSLIVAGVLAAAIVAIQLIYWKVIGGHWVIYSYGEQGFSWLHPHFSDYTFSYRSGWLTYTPLMILAVAGLILIACKGPQRGAMFLTLFPAYWCVCAWDIWWYAGMGGRAMVQYYAVLLFPFAAALQWIMRQKARIILALPFIALFVYVNIWFTWQAHRGHLYDSEGGMTRAYFRSVIGKWHVPAQVSKLKDGPYLYEMPLPAHAALVYKASLRNNDSLLAMDKSCERSPDYTAAFSGGALKWLRAEATFFNVVTEPVPWKMPQFYLGVWHRGTCVRQTMLRPQRFLQNGRPARISVDLRLPDGAAFDSLKIHFWNPGSECRLEICALEVRAF